MNALVNALRERWRLVALVLNAIAIGGFALIAVTSDKSFHSYFFVLEQQFEAMRQFYVGFALYVVFVSGSIAIVAMLGTLWQRYFNRENTFLKKTRQSLFFASLVIGIANIVVVLIPMLSMILLNALIWAIIIAITIAIVILIGAFVISMFSGGGGEGSAKRTSTPSFGNPNTGNLIPPVYSYEHYANLDRMRKVDEDWANRKHLSG